LDFGWIGVSHSNAEKDDSTVLGTLDNAWKLPSLSRGSVILSICQHNEDRGGKGSGRRIIQSLSGGQDSATNASPASILGDTINSIDKARLAEGDCNRLDGFSGEHCQAHSNILRPEGVSLGE